MNEQQFFEAMTKNDVASVVLFILGIVIVIVGWKTDFPLMIAVGIMCTVLGMLFGIQGHYGISIAEISLLLVAKALRKGWQQGTKPPDRLSND